MKLSFVIPIYNVDKYLRKCLDSIVNQTYPDIEIICVDDGSTDACADILREYTATDSRIQVITQRNQGTLLARKAGIMTATGEYILCIDPDDWFDEMTAETIVVASNQKKTDIIQFGVVVENEAGLPAQQIGEIRRYFNRQIDHMEGNRAILENAFIHQTIPFNQCGKAIRKKIAQLAFMEMPNIHCVFAEDQCSGYYIFSCSQNLQIIPQQLYHYRAGVGISTRQEMEISDYLKTLNSFDMYRALEQYSKFTFGDNPLHKQILEKIYDYMLITAIEFGLERTKENSNIREWVIPLCQKSNTSQIAYIIASKLKQQRKDMIKIIDDLNVKLKSQSKKKKKYKRLFLFLLVAFVVVSTLFLHSLLHLL